MIKINNLINVIKRLKRPLLTVAALAVFLLVGVLICGVLLSTNKLNVSHISLGANPAPEVPVIITPAVQKAPTDKPIAAIASAPIPALAAHTQPMVVTVPSSSVNSLKPTSTPSSGTSTTSTTSTTSGTVATTSYTSTNWSGYMATSGAFSAISASWYVPQVTGNGSTTTADATWVGIGGVSSSDLIQVGTDNTVDVSGKVTSVIFYELLPAAAQMVTGITVSPGDLIQASLSGSGGSWTIIATDVTTNQTFRTVVSYASTLSSAEWIQEDPSYASGQLVPFDNFGTINISGGSVTKNGAVMTLAAAGVSPITLVNSSGQVLASPSGLTSGGAGFSITRR
jgi:hypothetical protein